MGCFSSFLSVIIFLIFVYPFYYFFITYQVSMFILIFTNISPIPQCILYHREIKTKKAYEKKPVKIFVRTLLIFSLILLLTTVYHFAVLMLYEMILWAAIIGYVRIVKRETFRKKRIISDMMNAGKKTRKPEEDSGNKKAEYQQDTEIREPQVDQLI